MKNLSINMIKNIEKKYKILEDEGKSKDSIIPQLMESISEVFDKRAILGFDIYRYSQFPILEQTLIPFLLKELYKASYQHCLLHEPFIFKSKLNADFTDNFIDMGDGGFQILDNPLQAIIFSIYFQANLQRYNSHKSKDKIFRTIIGELTLRYSLTYDTIFKFQNNFYGSAIINNSRIISKDKLNRFLIDENSCDWFSNEINGVENLSAMDISDFKDIEIFSGYNIDEFKKETKQDISLIFSKEDKDDARILRSDLQRIGEIKSKLDTLSVHSLYLQALLYATTKRGSFNKYTVSLGNLNPSGITD
jgi:hypothetical protein